MLYRRQQRNARSDGIDDAKDKRSLKSSMVELKNRVTGKAQSRGLRSEDLAVKSSLMMDASTHSTSSTNESGM